MLYILLAVLMIAVDQGVKYWALTSLQAQQTIPLIDGVFHLTINIIRDHFRQF